MKSDVIQYDRVYRLLKSKIECGTIPVGSRLPGRSLLCREFGTSERTMRRVLELLEQDGFLEIVPRKRPVVISAFAAPDGWVMQKAKKADAVLVDDLMQTSVLLCYPIYLQGVHLCAGHDWDTPDMLFESMDPKRPREFWQLSSLLWRFFIARNENELLLRTVDSLGFRGKEPPIGTLEERERYCANIEKLIRTVKNGGEPGAEELASIFSQYKAIAEQAGERQFIRTVSHCPMLAEADGLDRQLSMAQERYSSVCLDLLGLIAIGRYRPGDRLPTHDELQKTYGVCRDTTVKAIRMLREWGVVTAAPRRGISVEMDLKALKKIQIAPESIACHVRRYLDSLELLSLTVERVAAHAASHAKPEDVKRLKRSVISQLDQPYEHQLIPRSLLDFITEQIRYDALRSIYRIVARNFSIGRSIPKLVSPDKNQQNLRIYHQCLEAIEILIRDDAEQFAKAASEIFAEIRGLIITECKRLGYWDPAMCVYDGSRLWR